MSAGGPGSSSDRAHFLPLALAAILSTDLAFGKTLPWSLLPWGLGRALWIALSFAFLVLCFMRESRIRLTDRLDQFVSRAGGSHARGSLVGLVLANLVFAVLNFRQFERFGYGMPWFQIGWCALAVFAVRMDRLWVSALFSIGMLVGAILHFPLHPERSDMLPVLAHGISQWRDAGLSPYADYVMENGVRNWFSYLPPILFSHLPAAWLGLDLRWNEVLYRFVWTSLVVRNATKTSTDAWRWVMHVFLLSPYFNFRHDLYFEIFFVWIAIYGFYARSRPWSLALMIATRQWAWVLAPFEVMRAWARRSGVRALAFFAFWCLVLAGAEIAVLAPATSWEQFVKSAFWFQERLEWKVFPGDYGLTLAPLVYSAGIAKVAQVIQGGAVLLAVGFVGLQQKSLRTGSLATVAILVFVLFNHHFWAYFWLTPSLWILCNEAA